MQLFNQLQYAKKHIAKSLIFGFTLKNHTPISCNVFVYNRKTGVLLSKTKSSETGEYVAFGLNGRNDHIVAIDPLQEYNLATQDCV